MCHIIGIESQFENIIKNGPYIPMTAGQRKPEVQWTPVERKAANLDQRLKSLIMFVLPDDQMNSAINCLTAKSTWDDLILYHEGPFDVKESRIVDLKLCYNTFKFKEGETLTQTFTRYKDLMNELVNDDIKLSKLEINTGFINGLPKKWISFCQTLRNTNHAKDSELASLFGSAVRKQLAKLNVTNVARKDKEEVSSDDNEMVEVKVHMALAEDNEVVRKECAKNGEWVNISMSKVHTLLEMEDNDDRKNYLDYLCIDLNYIEEQRNNLLSKHRNLVQELNTCKEQPLVLKQAKLDFLTIQHVNTEILKENQNLRIELKELTTITETWLNSSNKVNQCITDDTKVSIPGVERPWLSEDEGFILQNHDTGRILLAESQRNTTNPLVVVTDSLATDYDSADESLVCSIPLPLLKKLDGAEPVSGPKTIKLILRSKSTFKAVTLKGVILNEPSLAPARRNKSTSASKVNSAPAGKLKSVKIEDDSLLAICEKTGHRTCDHAEYMSTMNTSKHVKNQGGYSLRSRTPRPSKHFFPPCIHCGFYDHLSDDCVNYPICDICGSYDHDTHGHNRIVSLRRGIKPRNPQHVMKSYETCGSTVHTTTDHNDIEWFRKGEALQAKKAEALKSTKAESSNTIKSKNPTKRVENQNDIKVKQLRTNNGTEFRNSILINFCDKKGISQKNSSPYTPEQNGVVERKNRTLIEGARTMLSGIVFSKQYWNEAIATACYTQNRSTIVKRHLKTPYEIFRKHIPNIEFLYVFGCPIFIHNHKDHLGKFDEKAVDGYFLGYSLVFKAFRVFNTRRQQTKETYHITFDESPNAIKFTKPSVDNINIAKSERYPLDKYLHPYEPS
ncbi:retrovirus-related pol polyprotein from transposon TNT 1-94 [Tanacetum coccineum]